MPPRKNRKDQSVAGSLATAFDKGKVTKVTMALPRDQALAKLKEAAEVLARTPQGQGEAIEACVQSAAADELLRHPERDVRLWAAKCVAEGLRIFAPEPPFDTDRLRLVMLLFLEQLESLQETSSSNYVHVVGLMERLMEIRAFMLIFDCSEPEELLSSLVASCLSASRGASEGSRHEGHLAALLTSTLAEADEIPKLALVSLIEELSPSHRSGPAAGLVRRVFGGLAHRTAALPVNDFLNTALYSDASDDRIEALLGVVYELFLLDPALVARVLPNLQADLQAGNSARRRAVTSVVGKMLSHRPSSARPALTAMQPLLVDRHRERLADADEQVRLAALDGAEQLLLSALATSETADASSLTAMAVVKCLGERCLDPSEAVRLRTVEVVSAVGAASGGLKLLGSVCPEVFKRILDKRPRVREAAAEAAAQLYGQWVLPAWTDAQYDTAFSLRWLPRILCEAFSVFVGGRFGHVSHLEEYIEQHVLGCGAGYEASARGLALLGFCTSALGSEAAERGLALLLSRKRDANAALQHYLRMRIAKAGPLLDSGGGASVVSSESDPSSTAAASVALDTLLRLSPSTEDRTARPESLLLQLKAFDAVRDKALWTQLDRLTCPMVSESTAEMANLLAELDRLLRVHRLTELAPLLRRSLLSTWLLPDQVPRILHEWSLGFRRDVPAREESSQIFAENARRAICELARYFPGAFLPHAPAVARQMKSGQQETVRAALRALAALGKRFASFPCDVGGEEQRMGLVGLAENEDLVKSLLKAASTSSQDASTRGSTCRKAVRVLALLPSERRLPSLQELLDWAEARRGEESALQAALAFHMAAACLEHAGLVGHSTVCVDRERWRSEARRIIEDSSENADSGPLRCAAAELLTSAGDIDEVEQLLAYGRPPTPTVAVAATNSPLPLPSSDAAQGGYDVLPAHAAVAVLRALRLGLVQLTTCLLARLSSRVCAALMLGKATEADQLLVALQCLQRPRATGSVRLADRLRLCCTLPAVFALAPQKRHRDAVHRMLQASLAKAKHQTDSKQEPLLDFVTACFVHFLSRMELFRGEATASASAFPDSTKVSTFYCDALLGCDPSQSTELASVVLRVCDRVRYFVDKEDPTSDAVHRAASVLRYAMEKRCPDLGARGAAMLQGSRGSMPAEFFALSSTTATGRTGGTDKVAASALLSITAAGEKTPSPLVAAWSPRFGSTSGAAAAARASPSSATTPRRRLCLTPQVDKAEKAPRSMAPTVTAEEASDEVKGPRRASLLKRPLTAAAGSVQASYQAEARRRLS